MKALILLALLLPGCANQELVGVTYRAQAGRSVGELFGTGANTWQVSGEFRYDVKRR